MDAAALQQDLKPRPQPQTNQDEAAWMRRQPRNPLDETIAFSPRSPSDETRVFAHPFDSSAASLAAVVLAHPQFASSMSRSLTPMSPL